MELYSQLTIDITRSLEVVQEVESFLDINGVNYQSCMECEQFLFTFIGASKDSEIVEQCMELLKGLDCKSAWVFEHADEDPECVLYKLDNGKVSKVVCDFNLFDAISECDESELPRTLQDAAKLGPEKYFKGMYEEWSKGLKPMSEHWDYLGKIEDIISYC